MAFWFQATPCMGLRTTAYGGVGGLVNGTVFVVNIDGTGFLILHSFAGSEGANPGGLVLSGNTLYGTTANGGLSANGTVFNLLIPPELGITKAGMAVILFWPTNFSGFTLQSTTNLVSPGWTTNLPSPVVVNGNNFVTNPISGTRQFFRLSK